MNTTHEPMLTLLIGPASNFNYWSRGYSKMRTANWRTLKCEPQTANCRCEPTAKMRTEKMRTMCEWFDTMLRIIRHSEYAPVSKHMSRQMDLKVNSNSTAFTVAETLSNAWLVCIGSAKYLLFIFGTEPVAHASLLRMRDICMQFFCIPYIGDHSGCHC